MMNRLPDGVEARGGGWYRVGNEVVRGRDSAVALVSNGNGNHVQQQAAALLTEELNRIRFGAGYQYGTTRDVYTVAGYPRSYSFKEYWSRYQRQPEARRVVDMPAQTTWRNPPDIVETDKEDKDTKFTEAFEELRKRLALWQAFERADRLARVGRYGILLIGTRGPDNSLQTPLPKLSGPDDVLYVEAFDEGNARVKTFITDPRDPKYGDVETYEVTFFSEGTEQRSQLVHHSRVVHIAEDLLRDRVYGSPALEPVLNPLISLEKVSAATGEAYWQLADKIMVATIDKDAKVSPAQRTALGEALQELMHDLRRQIIMQGGELSWLGGDTPDPMGAAKLYMMQIAGAKGIPYRTMFGNETGERASGEDQKQYLGTIAERQERFAEPMILRAFVDRLIDAGALPRPASGYEVVWPTLWETPEKELAERDKAVAETAKALTPVGGDPLLLVEIDKDGRIHMVPRLPTDKSPFELPDPVEPDITPDGQPQEGAPPQEEAA